MRIKHKETFTTITTQGAILPPDLLARIAGTDLELGGLTPKDYHLQEPEKLNEAISRSWNRLQGCWTAFHSAREKLDDADPGTTPTRERWLLPLFQELGYGRLLTEKAKEIEGKSYPISHNWHDTPIHLVGCHVDLDRRTARVAGAAQSSPHSLIQEFLNRSEKQLWAFLSNGLKLRILRDNVSLTRQAYVEFDLEAMMEGEVYSDCVLLWLLCHQSRVEAGIPEECWLEKWSQLADEQGTRALDELRQGVEEAIQSLGRGFLAHPTNWALREKLKEGKLSKEDFYRRLLRLVYRLLFLFVAEDRNLLLDPNADPEARNRYLRFYSTSRLRELAHRHRGGRHADVYQGVRLVMERLGSDTGCPPLGLPALGSFLFSKKAVVDLHFSEISNEHFLKAIRALAFTQDGGALRPVDYKNLGSEELGSVYESLLELHPEINPDVPSFKLKILGGHERKTTGSYYTPTSLVNCLLDSAVDPVLEEAAKKPEPDKAIQAILNVKVCDPACGSGHFLIAAAHRIARRLAAIRTGDEEASPQETQRALRDVIGHCIYGVDVNPMAVELCKVALWMEAIEPGKPLSFLDHKIQCGNSLLGTTPRLIADGISNDAFRPIQGDDGEYAQALRRQNREERTGQTTFWTKAVAETMETYGSLSRQFQTLEEMGDDSVDAVHEKEEQYLRLSNSDQYRHAKLIADAWCAAFLWKKTKDAPLPVTEDLSRRLQSNPAQVPSETIKEINRLTNQYHLFQWHIAFPEVFQVPPAGEAPENEQTGWNGGFDVVLGNPPWERIKIQEKEWFASRDERIATARNAAARQKLIRDLKDTDPDLYASFLDAKRQSEGESHLARNSSRYPLCGKGDINTYSIFAETKRMILSPRGRVGCIVPSGIATDYTTQDFFRDLIETNSLASLFDFENRNGIFPGVHRSYKFCLLTLTGSHRPVRQGAEFAFFCLSVTDLREEDRKFTLSAKDLELINPNTKTCPIFRTRQDAELTKKIYQKIPVLIKEGPQQENPWECQITRTFDMARFAREALSRSLLEEEGLRLQGVCFINRSQWTPILESKTFWQFDHRYATYNDVSEQDALGGKPRLVSSEEKVDPDCVVLTRYWLPKTSVTKYTEWHTQGYWLAYRDITNTTNERTMVATVIPRHASDYTVRLIFGGKVSGREAACFVANLNSFCFDYVSRQSIAGTHFSDYLIKQLPVFSPEFYLEPAPWIGSQNFKEWIATRVLELTYTAWDLCDFAVDCGYKGPPFCWDEKRRFLIRCELDAAFFHLYLGTEEEWKKGPDELLNAFPTPRDAVDYILETFPIVKRKDKQKYGDYRTKETILQIYDRMQDAIAIGQSYKTLLDPPPADLRAAHRTAQEVSR